MRNREIDGKNEKKNDGNREKGEIKSRMKRITALYLTIFLTVILLISLYINISSFQKQFLANELSFYSVTGSRAVDKIEDGLFYGKSLDDYYGMEQLLEEWQKQNRNVTAIRVLSADRLTTYYQLGAGGDAFDGDSVSLEIRNSEGNLSGYLDIAVDLKERLEVLKKSRSLFLIGAAVLILAGISAIILFCVKGRFINEEYRLIKKKILGFMLLLILLLQAVFTIYSSVTLRDLYIEISNNTGEEIRSMVQADIDSVIAKGVTYDQIYDFDSYAEDVIEKAPIIESIRLSGRELKVIVSEEYIESTIDKMLLDMFTVLVTSMFIAAEIVNLMIISINKKVERITGTAAYDRQLSIRVSSFLIHVACYLPVSFIPILMYRFTGGGASDFLLGLPIMVLFASGVLFAVLAGGWSLRYGWRKLLFAGAALVAASSLLAGLFENPAVLVIARGMYGAAYSLVYIAIREFAATGQGRQERSKGLAQVTAGLYAGINIGAVLGAMIFETAGFRAAFAVSAIVGALAILVLKKYCLPDEAPGAEEEKESETDQREALKDGKEVLSVIKDRGMLRLIIFIIAPLAIASLFFEYFLPVYAVKAGIGSADIGRAFLINGLAIAYGAPLVGKYFAARISERASVFLFTALMAAGFLAFGFTGGLAGILIASAVMGIAEGAALVSQNGIMLDLPVAEKAGTSRILGIYSIVRKLSQAVGPQVFAAFMLMGYEFGMIGFGAVLAVCSALYIWREKVCRNAYENKGEN